MLRLLRPGAACFAARRHASAASPRLPPRAAAVPPAGSAPAAPAVDASGVQRFALSVPPELGGAKAPRLDAYVSAALPPGTSRARVTAAIKAGALTVNGRAVTKPSQPVRAGDALLLTLAPLPPMEAAPEALPLDVVFEDDSVLVVNKAAHMVVHPSAGHASGTLVNAVLHHCALPAMRVASGSAPRAALFPEEGEQEQEQGDDGDEDGDEEAPALLAQAAGGAGPVLRPGIVHRLDKGTSGLLVIAKDAAAHASLCAQFAARSVSRRYEALLLGAPAPASGRVDAPVGRDPGERLRMAVVWAPGAPGARPAASRYETLEVLAAGRASRVAWRLETGRTHQIRVHARHIGNPLLGDELYGGGGGAAAAMLGAGGPPAARAAAAALVAALPAARPCLHAAELGFDHPVTGQRMQFEVPPPEDFAQALAALRAL